MKTQLHRKYGPNMVNLYNPVTGDFNMNVWKQTRNHKGYTAIYDVDGYEIDSDVASSFFLGWIAGMQYQLDYLGPCFTTSLATIDSFSYLS
jgi:hypothetical protein